MRMFAIDSNAIILFFMGMLEMLVITSWTSLVVRAKVLYSGLVTVFNIMVWYYVLQRIIENIDNWQVAIVYAVGCACGTMIATFVTTDKGKSLYHRAIGLFKEGFYVR